ncbi:MAG TPA: tetratricopeptide repeat protein [Longimicrobiales bacterium]
MMARPYSNTWPLLLLITWACGADRPPIPPDDIVSARMVLAEEREAVLAGRDMDPAERVERMVELGLWAAADSVIAAAEESAELLTAAAELRFRQHRYEEAESLVERALALEPEDRRARLLRARLKLQAWDLEAAAAIADSLIDERDDAGAALLRGRIALFEKRFDEALEWAERARAWGRRDAGGYVLEADVHFWKQDLAAAEAALVRALAVDPLDADARFWYGYAIWRKVDAGRLDDMAAQWELALETNPLHLLTHWHWGNGHTHLTYADYASPNDSIVRARLREADRLIARDQVAAAIELTRAVEREFAESVLPTMTRGSAFYMAYDLPVAERLDSAAAAFRAVLRRKPHYGPAHNGLAAVIKQRQFTYLAAYDSLEAAIASTPTPTDPAFAAVFDDVAAYPGDRVEKMVRAQLGPSIAYVPLLRRLHRTFTIPPLHVDLAEAMGNPALRSITTFDNRQWMDIRGIGGGATGIEYLERGAHWERNVLVHEYTHLYHGTVLTDAEVRRIRELYHDAVRNGRTLDYYAANNESEYFAQAYEAYISPVKAHPLSHKSMNTREDLRRKDPAMYAFVDSLIARQREYLDGDRSALRSNWAQAYTVLSERARRGETPRSRRAGWGGQQWFARVYLDSALVLDPEYLPAYLSYAALHRDAGRFPSAERWLDRAEALDSTYAPIYRARAEFVGARARAWGLDEEGALLEQVALYEKAIALESDLAERAELNEALRTLYLEHGRIPDAIRVAEAYVAEAPTLSTYLRDRRDEAAAFAAMLRARIGYAAPTLEFFADLLARKPQQYDHRLQYAEALAIAGRADDAVRTLEEGQRILRAAGRPRADYLLAIAEIELARGDTAAASAAVEPIRTGAVRVDGHELRWLRVLASLGETARAAAGIADVAEGRTRAERAEHAFTRGWIAARRGAVVTAERAFREALDANPYHRRARVALALLLARGGRDESARAVIAAADTLPLPLGPDFQREIAEALAGVGA